MNGRNDEGTARVGETEMGHVSRGLDRLTILGAHWKPRGPVVLAWRESQTEGRVLIGP